MTVDGHNQTRRLDIADVGLRKGIEYKTGYQALTADNLWEMRRDAELVNRGWQIEWFFVIGHRNLFSMLWTKLASSTGKGTDMGELSKKDQFEIWLMEMDNAIAAFKDSLAPGVRSRLDGSEASLDVLEALILERYPTPADTRKPGEAAFLDGAARYVGEVIREHTGSKWTMRHDDPRFVFHGLPILAGAGKLKNVPECPLSLVTASTDRRTGKYLSTVLRNLRA